MHDADFYYGLGSRYSYLAFSRIDGIEARTGCRFILHPISSIELLALLGRSPFAGQPVSGQYDWRYRREDAELWADYYGIPFVEPPALPEDHRLMARACRAAERQGSLREYSGRLFGLVYASGRPVDRARCVALAGRMGLDPARFVADLDSAAVDLQVTADAQAAVRRGVFGVPTFFVGDRMIWGNDRLVLLEHLLTARN